MTTDSEDFAYPFEPLRPLGLTEHETGWWEDQVAAQGITADLELHQPSLRRVVEVQRDHLLLHDGRSTAPARVTHALQRQLEEQADALAVGDWVLARAEPRPPASPSTPAASAGARPDTWVHERLPPRNQLARRLNDGRDKNERLVIVSNVDTALLVMGLDGDFNLRRLERYLALVRMAGVQAVAVLTKADCVPDAAQRVAAAQAALPSGASGPSSTPCIALNALDATASQAALQAWLQPGHTLVLLGSSGAGKSTLTNALVNGHAASPAQATGGTRLGDGRGRHTTTVRSLHRCASGACIIDTPGLRTLRLDGDEQALAKVYDDVAQLATQCRFRNCQHANEPGCAVREGVGSERLNSWHKLQREARRDTMTALERQRQLSEWKQRGKAGKQRWKEKQAAGG